MLYNKITLKFMHKIVKQLQKSMLEADVVAILLEEEKK